MRDKLIKILQDMRRVAFTNEEKADYLMQHDVVSVIRCKDCKYSTQSEASENYWDCENYGCSQHEDYYCADGERRTE